MRRACARTIGRRIRTSRSEGGSARCSASNRPDQPSASSPCMPPSLRWRNVFRSTAPAHLPRSLLLRIIAYRIQANAFGDLDRETARYLYQIARDYEKRRAAGERRSGKNPPPIPPVPNRHSLKPGTMLAREHGGVLHRVIVGEGGFSWNDASYKSLSEVARAITGTNWNGPRFFGLRDSKAAQNGAEGS